MEKTKIFIGVPNLGTIRVGLWMASLNWLVQGKYTFQIFPPSDIRPIPAARNLIVKRFLETDYDYLLMIDADIVPPSNVLELAEFKKDIIGTVCFIEKEDGIIPTALKRKGTGYQPLNNIIGNQLLGVDATGTGCLMIRRNVLETLHAPYFRYVMGPEGNLIKGEDFEFCDRARQHGFEIFVHSGYISEHFHTVGLSKMNMAIMKSTKSS